MPAARIDYSFAENIASQFVQERSVLSIEKKRFHEIWNALNDSLST